MYAIGGQIGIAHLIVDIKADLNFPHWYIQLSHNNLTGIEILNNGRVGYTTNARSDLPIACASLPIFSAT